MQWLGKLCHEFYHIPNMHSSKENIQETEQMPAVIKDTHEDAHEEADELIMARRNHGRNQ